MKKTPSVEEAYDVVAEEYTKTFLIRNYTRVLLIGYQSSWNRIVEFWMLDVVQEAWLTF